MGKITRIEKRLMRTDVDNRRFKNASESDFKLFVGNRLKEEIDSKFVSREAFMKQCKIIAGYNEQSRPYIRKDFLSSIINGRSQLPYDKAEVFAKVLDVDLDYILGYQDEKNRDKDLKKVLYRLLDEDYDLYVASIMNMLRLLKVFNYDFRFNCSLVGDDNLKQYYAIPSKDGTSLRIEEINSATKYQVNTEETIYWWIQCENLKLLRA